MRKRLLWSAATIGLIAIAIGLTLGSLPRPSIQQEMSFWQRVARWLGW